MCIASRALLVHASEGASDTSPAKLDTEGCQRKPMTSAKGHCSSKQVQFSKWVVYVGLTVLVLLAEVFIFEDSAGLGEWLTFDFCHIPELALVVSAGLLLATRTNALAPFMPGPSSHHRYGVAQRRVQMGRHECSNVAGDHSSSDFGRAAPDIKYIASAPTVSESREMAFQRTNAIVVAARRGEKDKAEQLLLELENSACCKSAGAITSCITVAYTTLIDAYAKHGNIDGAESLFGRMVEKGVEPNAVTFSAMIDACAKAGNRARAETWFSRMVECGVAPCSHSYSAVINACAKQGGPDGAEAAEKWLDHSEQAGAFQDVVLYASVISACGKSGDGEGAQRIFNRMRASGVKANIVAYAALAHAFATHGDWIKVESIARDMATDGIMMNEFFVSAQLLAYARARPSEAERAEACFRSALNAGIEANGPIVGVLSRAVGQSRCAELMQELCGGRTVQGVSTAAWCGAGQWSKQQWRPQ